MASFMLRGEQNVLIWFGMPFSLSNSLSRLYYPILNGLSLSHFIALPLVDIAKFFLGFVTQSFAVRVILEVQVEV